MWVQSKKDCYSVVRTTASCLRDKIVIFIERHWPMVCYCCVRLAKAVLILISCWKDCIVQGFRSFLGLGSAALLLIMWSCFLSLTSMSCLVYVLLSMVCHYVLLTTVFFICFVFLKMVRSTFISLICLFLFLMLHVILIMIELVYPTNLKHYFPKNNQTCK